MKTTVQISDSLLSEARKIAVLEKTSVKALIEEGLRNVISQRKTAKPFRLRKVTFKGDGLNPAMAGASWETIREAAYEGRGG